MFYKIPLFIIFLISIFASLAFNDRASGAYNNSNYNITKTDFNLANKLNDQTSKPRLANQVIDGKPALSIYTDKRQYVPGEIVKIFGNVYNETGNPITEKVDIQISSYDNEHKRSAYVYNSSILAVNGSYIIGFDTPLPNQYTIVASLNRWNEKVFTKFDSIDVINPSVSTTSLMLYIGVTCFVIFLALLPVISGYTVSITQLLSFALISAIVLSPLAALLSTNVELGVDSPIGLILKSPVNEKPGSGLNILGHSELGGEWMINVGGNKHNNYAGGIQIPIYVVTFGLIGGYLRYLYDTTSDRQKRIENEIVEIEKVGDEKEKKRKKRRLFVYINLKTLGLVFLSPILAIAVWFTLSQIGIQGQAQSTQGQTGIFVLAAISFTVALVTEEIVQYLIDFAKGNILFSKQAKNKEEKRPKNTSQTTESIADTSASSNHVEKQVTVEKETLETNILDSLEKLSNLKQKCNLTEDEFQRAKEQLFKKGGQLSVD